MIYTPVPWRLPARSIQRPPPQARTWLVDSVAAAPKWIGHELQQHGLELAPASVLDPPFLQAAQAEIASEPDLCAVVHDVVREVHLLCAAPSYDVSHSEPRWTGRIFVSVPERHDQVGALRFAESVIHEAMHLELTLQERAEPLIADAAGLMLSPWRDELRPFQGVMHGLFVFSCLLTYFERQVRRCTGAAESHVQGRLAQIHQEITQINLDVLCRAATPLGASLVRRWAACIA